MLNAITEGTLEIMELLYMQTRYRQQYNIKKHGPRGFSKL